MTTEDLIARVRQRIGPKAPASLPPVVHEPTARRVYSDLGLPELFVHAARRGGMAADLVHVEELVEQVANHLGHCGVSRVGIASSPVLRKLRLSDALTAAGFTAADPGGADALVTGCAAAVGETGTLVFYGGVPAGWLRTPTRVAILEPKNFLPDLIDLFARPASDTVLVSGPTVRTFVLH